MFRRSKLLFLTTPLGAEIWPVGRIWVYDGKAHKITKHRPSAAGIRVYGRRLR